MKKPGLIIISASLLFAIGCGKENYNYDAESGCDLSGTAYNNGIKEIITSNCAYAGCHAGGVEFYDFTTYKGVKAEIGSFKDRINRSVDDPLFMPQNKSKLNNCDLQKLNNWIEKGAPLN